MATPATFNWAPTTTRVVLIDGFGPFPRGSLQTTPSPLIWPVKDPADTLDFVVDYSEALAGNEGDAIATLDVAISPSGQVELSLVNSRAEGVQAVLWLAGGQPGTNYAVTVVASTNSGRNISRTISLPVVALSVQSAFGSILTNQAGVAITDQMGGPLTTQ